MRFRINITEPLGKLSSRSIRMFTREQCTWIPLEYAKNLSPTIERQEFVKKYMCNICGTQKSKYCPHHFTRVFERFKSRGIAPALYSGSYISKATPQAKQLISREIQENSTSSIRQIARKLDFPNDTTRKILQKELSKAIQVSAMPRIK